MQVHALITLIRVFALRLKFVNNILLNIRRIILLGSQDDTIRGHNKMYH